MVKSNAPLWGVRSILMLLVLSCLLPGLLGASILLMQQYRQGRQQLEQNTLQTTRALAQAVDNHVLRARAIAQVLAASEALATGDLARFHRQAQEAVTASELATNIILLDEAGKQLLNTAADFGSPLPVRADPKYVRQVFSTGQPVLTDVVVGNLLKRPIVATVVPVRSDRRITYALAVGMLMDRFDLLLQGQRLPPDWIVGILDTAGTFVARTHAPEQFVGRKASADLQRFIAGASEGVQKATTVEGAKVVSVHVRSPTTGWHVAIGIPRSAMTAELYRTLAQLAAGVMHWPW